MVKFWWGNDFLWWWALVFCYGTLTFWVHRNFWTCGFWLWKTFCHRKMFDHVVLVMGIFFGHVILGIGIFWARDFGHENFWTECMILKMNA